MLLYCHRLITSILFITLLEFHLTAQKTAKLGLIPMSTLKFQNILNGLLTTSDHNLHAHEKNQNQESEEYFIEIF